MRETTRFTASPLTITCFSISTSSKGWTSDFLCAEWFVKVFLPDAEKHRNPAYPKSPIILIIDGHGSHVADEVVTLAVKHRVEIIMLPPHTTHKLQPLDVGVFGPLQKAWQKRCVNKVTTTRIGMQRKDVVREYMLARAAAFKLETIIKAFERCGICPTRNPFTEADYAPSMSSSICAHVPIGFSTESPTSDDISMLCDLGIVDSFVYEDAELYEGYQDSDVDDDDMDMDMDINPIDEDTIWTVDDTFRHVRIDGWKYREESDSEEDGDEDEDQETEEQTTLSSSE
jgi:hypothetical protein